jgi:RNA recognition motif-containing protein
MSAPTPTVAPEPSPPPPYSALPQVPEIEDQPDLELEKTHTDPCNLFIKNLDDEVIVTQRDLENLFGEYGTITSAFLATHPTKDSYTQAVSKGFGFVAFSRPQEADLARESMHGTVVGRKKIFVGYAEKKEDRRMRLKVFFANREKLAEEMKSELAIKDEMVGEIRRDVRDERISRRSVVCAGSHDRSTTDIVPIAELRPALRSLSH